MRWDDTRRRHPAEVTMDRLDRHYVKWSHLMDEADRIAIERVLTVLDEIAQGDHS